MTEQDLVLLERQDGVAVVRLNRPDVLNALSMPLRRRLAEVFEGGGGVGARPDRAAEQEALLVARRMLEPLAVVALGPGPVAQLPADAGADEVDAAGGPAQADGLGEVVGGGLELAETLAGHAPEQPRFRVVRPQPQCGREVGLGGRVVLLAQVGQAAVEVRAEEL